MPHFKARATLTYRTTVEVEAADLEEAQQKFKNSEWDDDNHSGAELIDWDVGSVEEEKG